MTWLRPLCLALLVPLAPLSTALAAPTPVATTEHFRFFGHGDVRHSIERLVPDAEARFGRICRQLAACQANSAPIDIWVAEDAHAFAQTFGDPHPMTEWAVGVAFPAQRRIILRAYGSALFSLTETFDHEVSHVVVHALTGGRGVPRWLTEGIAIYQAGEDLIERLEVAHRAAVTGQLLSFDELDQAFPSQGPKVGVAYAQSALFVRFLMREHGPGAIAALLYDLQREVDFDVAFEARFEAPAALLNTQWQDEIESSSSSLMLFRDGSLFWVIMTLLFVYVAMRQRRERRALIEAMGDDEAAEVAFDEVEIAFDALALSPDPGQPPTLH